MTEVYLTLCERYEYTEKKRNETKISFLDPMLCEVWTKSHKKMCCPNLIDKKIRFVENAFLLCAVVPLHLIRYNLKIINLILSNIAAIL